MRNSILTIALLGISITALAQQDPQMSLFRNNQQLFNPAAVSAYNKVDGMVYSRYQWIGLSGAPLTIGLNAGMNIGETNSRAGLKYFYEEIGQSVNHVVGLQYAYRLQMGARTNLSFGLEANFKHLRYYAIWIATDPNDPNIPDPNGSGAALDAAFGLLLQNDRLQVSISSTNLLEPDFGNALLQARRHYYVYASYSHPLGPSFNLVPQVLAKADFATTQLDVGVKFEHTGGWWLYGAYRTQDALIVGAGLDIKERWQVGAAYVHTTSRLSAHSSGSVEGFVRYRIKRD